MISYEKLLESRNHKSLPQRLLCFDPGETTGWAEFTKGKLLDCGQIKTKSMKDTYYNIKDLFRGFQPSHTVLENYKIYEWKSDTHAWSQVHTIRVIGCIWAAGFETLTEFTAAEQLAQQAKSFVTDEKLKAWNMYVKGQRHARDAIRHGIYYLLFNHKS